MKKPQLLSVKDVADKLNISIPRVHQLIQEGRIAAQKVGRDYVIMSDAITDDLLERPTGRPPKEKIV